MKKIFILLIIAILLTGCLKEEKADAYGTITAEELYLSPEVSAKITEVRAKEGTKYKKGDLLAVLDTTDISLKINELEANIMLLENKLSTKKTEIELLVQEKNNLEEDRQRFMQLVKAEAAAEKNLDDIIATLKVQELRIKQAEKTLLLVEDEIGIAGLKLEQAENLKTKYYIHAPVAGTILESYYHAGEFAVMGKPLIKLADLQTVLAELYVTETLLSEIELGGEVRIKIDTRNKSQRMYKGMVTKIASEAEFTPKIIQTREERTRLVYKIDVECINDGALKIGMPVEMELIKG